MNYKIIFILLLSTISFSCHKSSNSDQFKETAALEQLPNETNNETNNEISNETKAQQNDAINENGKKNNENKDNDEKIRITDCSDGYPWAKYYKTNYPNPYPVKPNWNNDACIDFLKTQDSLDAEECFEYLYRDYWGNKYMQDIELVYIPVSEFSNIKDYINIEDQGHSTVKEAQYKNKRVILKRIGYSLKEINNKIKKRIAILRKGAFSEYFWSKLISNLELGPKVYGVTFMKIKSEFSIMLVSKLITNSEVVRYFPRKNSKSKRYYKKIVKFCVDYPSDKQDWQYLLDDDGNHYLFDTGWYDPIGGVEP